MMTYDKKNDELWYEKYRPKTVDGCILPEELKSIFKGFIQQKSFPNLLLYGSAGVGKTTIAKALCNELGYEYIFINASEDRNISMVRDTIEGFAGKMSITQNPKCVILDEADGLTGAAQGALRGIFEKYKKVRFILTCNYVNKIIEPISKSRLTMVDFSTPQTEKNDLIKSVAIHTAGILKMEGIKFDARVLVELVKKHYPDHRRILNDLQMYSMGGEIDVGILSRGYSIEPFIEAISAKNWKDSRKWLADNSDIETATLYSDMEKHLYDKVVPEYMPAFIKTLADYLNTSVNTPSTEINNAGMLATLFMDVEFK